MKYYRLKIGKPQKSTKIWQEDKSSCGFKIKADFLIALRGEKKSPHKPPPKAIYFLI
jgi:hypothetical protein